MIITLRLSPQVPIGEVMPLVIERQGEIIVINGDALDLSFMSVGDSLPFGSIDHPLLASAAIGRDELGYWIDGLLFHIAAGQTDPAVCFPEPVIIQQDGVVSLPAQTPPLLVPTPEPEPELVPIETSHGEAE
ncbi:hypothetical protein [Alcaligenes faecalis]|uniref:hypothetical protein n=1 Tax=Alcaligenes faecalis TaxID=511 RepID=UPI001EF0F496|nr:hypothetical protein [Alcaligenes faecalis]ULH08590.1 hypothetical protein MF263_09110 [Alcaligenes faecalis]